jgi:hypothetical protein
LCVLSVTSGQLDRLRYDSTVAAQPVRQAADTVASAFYPNGGLEGAPVTTLVKRLKRGEVTTADGIALSGLGLNASWDSSTPGDWVQGDPFSIRRQAVTRLAAGEYLPVLGARRRHPRLVG